MACELITSDIKEVAGSVGLNPLVLASYIRTKELSVKDKEGLEKIAKQLLQERTGNLIYRVYDLSLIKRDFSSGLTYDFFEKPENYHTISFGARMPQDESNSTVKKIVGIDKLTDTGLIKGKIMEAITEIASNPEYSKKPLIFDIGDILSKNNLGFTLEDAITTIDKSLIELKETNPNELSSLFDNVSGVLLKVGSKEENLLFKVFAKHGFPAEVVYMDRATVSTGKGNIDIKRVSSRKDIVEDLGDIAYLLMEDRLFSSYEYANLSSLAKSNEKAKIQVVRIKNRHDGEISMRGKGTVYNINKQLGINNKDAEGPSLRFEKLKPQTGEKSIGDIANGVEKKDVAELDIEALNASIEELVKIARENEDTIYILPSINPKNPAYKGVTVEYIQNQILKNLKKGETIPKNLVFNASDSINSMGSLLRYDEGNSAYQVSKTSDIKRDFTYRDGMTKAEKIEFEDFSYNLIESMLLLFIANNKKFIESFYEAKAGDKKLLKRYERSRFQGLDAIFSGKNAYKSLENSYQDLVNYLTKTLNDETKMVKLNTMLYQVYGIEKEKAEELAQYFLEQRSHATQLFIENSGALKGIILDRLRKEYNIKDVAYTQLKTEPTGLSIEDSTTETNEEEIVEENYSPEEVTVHDSMEEEESVRGNEGWGDKQKSAMASATQEVRSLLGRIFARDQYTRYGDLVRMSPSRVFAILLTNLNNINSSSKMMKEIQNLTKNGYPEFQVILDTIKLEKNVNGYSDLETQIFNAFRTTENSYMYPSESRTEEGQIKRTFKSTNYAVSNKKVVEMYEKDITKSLFDLLSRSDIKWILDSNENLLTGIATTKKDKKTQAENLHKLLTALGFNLIGKKELELMFYDQSRESFIQNILSNLKSIVENSGSPNVPSQVRNIITALLPFSPVEYKEASTSVAGERRYRYTKPSFISDFMNEILGVSFTEEKDKEKKKKEADKYIKMLEEEFLQYEQYAFKSDDGSYTIRNVILKTLYDAAHKFKTSDNSLSLSEYLRKNVPFKLNQFVTGFNGEKLSRITKAEHLSILLSSFSTGEGLNGVPKVRIQVATYSDSHRIDFMDVKQLRYNEVLEATKNNIISELHRMYVDSQIKYEDENDPSAGIIKNIQESANVALWFEGLHDTELKQKYFESNGEIDNKEFDKALTAYAAQYIHENRIKVLREMANIGKYVKNVKDYSQYPFANDFFISAETLNTYNKAIEGHEAIFPNIGNTYGIDIFNVLADIYSKIGESEEITEIANKLLDILRNDAQRLETFIDNNLVYKQAIFELTGIDPSYYKSKTDTQKRMKQLISPRSGLDVERMRNYSSTTGTTMQRAITLREFTVESTNIEALKDFYRSLQTSKENGISYYTKKEVDSLIDDLNKINSTDGQSFRLLESYMDMMKASGRYSEFKELHDKIVAKMNGEEVKLSMDELFVAFQAIKPYSYGTREAVMRTKTGKTVKKKAMFQYKNSESPILAILQVFANDVSQISEEFRALIEAINQYTAKNEKGIDVIHFEGVVKVGEQTALIDINPRKKGNKKTKITAKSILQQLEKKGAIVETDYRDTGIQQATPPHFVDFIMSIGSQVKKLIMSDLPKGGEFATSIPGMETLSSEEIKREYTQIIQDRIIKETDKLMAQLGTPEKLVSFILGEVKKNPDRYGRDVEEALQIITAGGKKHIKTLLSDPVLMNKIQPIITNTVKKRVLEFNISGGTAILAASVVASRELKVVLKEDKSVDYVECLLPAYTQKLIEKYADDDGNIDISKIEDPNVLNMIGYRVPTEDKYSILPLKVVGFLPPNVGSTILVPHDYIVLAGWDFDVDKLFLMVPSLTETEDKKGLRVDYGNAEGKDLNEGQEGNRIIELMRSVLTNKDMRHRVLNRGGFEDLKQMSRKIKELSYRASQGNAVKYEDFDSLGKVNIETDIPNYNSPIYDVYYKSQNSIGLLLVGIMAVANSHHAFIQGKDFEVGGENTFSLGGKTLKSISRVSYQEADKIVYLSKVISEYLAASVDNAKDPLLESLGLTRESVNTFLLLVRLGFPLKTIALFMNSPAVKSVYKEVSNGRSFAKAIGEELEDLKSLGYVSGASGVELTDEVLFDSYYIVPSKQFGIKEINIIGKIYETLKTVHELADTVSEVVKYSRQDTTKFWGPYASSILVQEYGLQRVAEKIGKEKSKVKTNTLASNTLTYEKLKDYHKSKKNKGTVRDNDFMQYYHTAVRHVLKNVFSENSLEFTKGFRSILDKLFLEQGNSKPMMRPTEEAINKVMKDLYVWYMSGHGFFKPFTDGKKVTLQEVRADYIYNFPLIFQELKKKYPQKFNQYRELLRRLKIQEEGETLVISLPWMDRLNQEAADKITATWEEMLYDENPEIKELAYQLFRYTFFRTGFGFSGKGFSHLVPSKLKDSILNFNDRMKNLHNILQKGSLEEEESFVEQFIVNNIDLITDVSYMYKKQVDGLRVPVNVEGSLKGVSPLIVNDVVGLEHDSIPLELRFNVSHQGTRTALDNAGIKITPVGNEQLSMFTMSKYIKIGDYSYLRRERASSNFITYDIIESSMDKLSIKYAYDNSQEFSDLEAATRRKGTFFQISDSNEEHVPFSEVQEGNAEKKICKV